MAKVMVDYDDGWPSHFEELRARIWPAVSTALRNHLVVRDCLRANPDIAREYGDLKKRLAREFPDDIDACIAGKTELLCRVLAVSGMSEDELEKIRRVNAPAR